MFYIDQFNFRPINQFYFASKMYLLVSSLKLLNYLLIQFGLVNKTRKFIASAINCSNTLA